MGGAVSTGLDNDDLIDNLLQAHYIKTAEIERVFRAVDRAAYFLPEFQMNAYKDLAWKSGNIHISAPCIYSVVMENLKLSPGLSFLNVGSGTGYLSTMVGLILGPYGVNHGIEMHADLIKYAYEKLLEFKKKSPALDCFEFCDPTFVKGNGLCLPSDMRQYDRVYCGAACPENHENYMKNLIKVGGILVMPLNDQLLQITRVSQTQWESQSVLPVSFATLQLPSTLDSKGHVALPDTEPISLQAVCRSCIRRTLRSNVELEHPKLTKPRRKRLHPRKKRSTIQDFVIPFLESSDEEHDSDSRSPRLRQARITAVFDMGRTWPGRRRLILRSGIPTHHSDSNTQEPSVSESKQNDDEPKEKTTPTPSPYPSTASQILNVNYTVPKREKFDSGVGDEIENGKGLTSSDEENETHANSFVHMTSDEESMDIESDVDVENSDDEGVDLSPLPRKATKTENDEPEEYTYSSLMKDKIQSLPLPPMLKAYLNLHRDF